MEKVHVQRLLKLADFLDNLPRKKFNFGAVVSGKDKPRKELDCGSVGCAIGWCPVVFPKLAKYSAPEGDDDDGWGRDVELTEPPDPHYGFYSYVDVGAKLFGIDRHQSRSLFTPNGQDELGYEVLSEKVGPKRVAKLLRRFVKDNAPDLAIRIGAAPKAVASSRRKRSGPAQSRGRTK